MLASLASRKDVKLGPRPGKLKTTVHAPVHVPAERISLEDGPSNQFPSPGGRSESPRLLIPGSEDETDDVLPVSADIGGIGRRRGAGGMAIRPKASSPGPSGPVTMVDLDSSDVEL